MNDGALQDIAVVGGGIVGLATALELLTLRPGLRLILIEKEKEVAAHQTGHNSGVIHSGLYYRPGSLKADLCVKGARRMITFCQENGIPYQQCGKVVVATTTKELPALDELYRRGVANGVPQIARMGADQLREIEPHAQGIHALHVPTAGIVDYRKVANTFAQKFQSQGGVLQTDTHVQQLIEKENRFIIESSQGKIETRFFINCGGLHADRIAKKNHADLSIKIIPFRGEYYELIPDRRHLVKGLIYPVPDPRFPFLGVHFTKRIDGTVEAGPNAVLALKREGYRKTDIRISDLLEMLLFPGFWKMAGRYWKTGLEEMHRSFSKKAFVHSLQRLIPEIEERDLIEGGSGVRAQAVDRGGKLLDDFYLVKNRRAIHVCNAPSPAATASLSIGEHIADAASHQFQL